MSLSCPRCGNSIEQDFGVITCSKCAAVLFIDMEGRAQLSGDGGAAGESADPVDEASAAPVMAEPAADFEGFSNETAATAVAHSASSMAEPQASPEMEFADAISEPEIGATEATPLEASMMAAAYNGDSGSLSEVSEFGNSNRDFGALSYSILIEHIDTSEIRKKLSDALSDSKFQWDVSEILQRIEMGRLELTELTPAKASILVRRLQEVPVTVSWNQKLL